MEQTKKVFCETRPRQDSCNCRDCTPTTKTGVRAFLWMVRQLESWIPNLSFLSKNMRALTHQNTHFTWTEECQQEFQIISEVVGQVKFLTPFYNEKPLVLYTDASKEGGMGYVWVQPGVGYFLLFLKRQL